jgi:hypothetical protein
MFREVGDVVRMHARYLFSRPRVSLQKSAGQRTAAGPTVGEALSVCRCLWHGKYVLQYTGNVVTSLFTAFRDNDKAPFGIGDIDLSTIKKERNASDGKNNS